MQKIFKAIDDKALADFVLENTGKLKVFIGKENKNNLENITEKGVFVKGIYCAKGLWNGGG